MTKLNPEGQINLVVTVLCIIVFLVSWILALFVIAPENGGVAGSVFTAIFGTFLPGIAIYNTWDDNFGKFYLKKKEQFKKKYMEGQ